MGDGRKDALWLTDRQLPAWVKRNLQLLPGGVPFPMPSFIPPEASSGSPKEQQWVEVFTNLPAFWDNRLNVGVGWGPTRGNVAATKNAFCGQAGKQQAGLACVCVVCQPHAAALI